jgi:hypothetical protein
VAISEHVPEQVKAIISGATVYGGAGVSLAGILNVVQPIVAIVSGLLASAVALAQLYKMYKNWNKD